VIRTAIPEVISIVLIHFQLRGEHGWESMGSGVSNGEDPLRGAIDDLRSLHEGVLPRGSYRYIEAHGAERHMGSFEFGADGELLK
jgi:hypothetical protein